MQFLSQTSPPDAQCRFLLEVKQMPQWVVSSEVLTTHKVWGKVLFDHSNFAQSLATFVLNFRSFAASPRGIFACLSWSNKAQVHRRYKLWLHKSCKRTPFLSFRGLEFRKMTVALRCFQSLAFEILPMPANSDLYSPWSYCEDQCTLRTRKHNIGNKNGSVSLFRSFVPISTLNSSRVALLYS